MNHPSPPPRWPAIDLLRGLTGIDQRRLFSWSGEALKLALMPFRGVMSMIPGTR